MIRRQPCSAEVGIAQSRGSRLLPLLVERGLRHPLLAASQYADHAADPASARSRLREALRRIDAVGGWGWPDGRSPFPGLLAFDGDLHRAFFGRHAEIQELAELLRSPTARGEGRLLLVVGPSGCGKSSLVRAGLAPMMAAEMDWLTLSPFFPGREPLMALAGELAAAARQLGLRWALPDTHGRLVNEGGLVELADELLVAASDRQRRRHLLVIVDQFEEVLTQTTAAARRIFAEVLQPALTGPVQAVATIRPESMLDMLASQELAVLPVRTFTLRPLDRGALPAVVRGPARLAGIEVDDELLDRLVADTGAGDALPLLAFTLAELAVGVGPGGHLSFRRYEELGGVHGALQRQADAALRAAMEASGRRREDVLADLLRLVTIDERGDPARWRLPYRELPTPVRAELDAFVARRLLTTDVDESGGPLIGVAHEAFLATWPPLARAIEKAASGLRARREVERAALDWEQAGRPRRRLWEGTQLADAVAATGAQLRRPRMAGASPATGGVGRSRRGLPDWLPVGQRVLVTDHVELSAPGRDFLRRSIRRAGLRRSRGVTILVALLALAVTVTGVFARQNAELDTELGRAAAEQLVGVAQRTDDNSLTGSALLSAAAYDTDPGASAQSSLFEQYLRLVQVDRVLLDRRGPVADFAMSADGTRMIAQLGEGALVLLRPDQPGTPLRTIGRGVLAAISPDGSAYVGDNGFGQVTLGSEEGQGRVLHQRSSVPTSGRPAADLQFDRAGRRVLAVLAAEGVLVWDVASGQRIGTAIRPASGRWVDHAWFGPDTSTVITFTRDDSGAQLAVWDLATGARRRVIGQDETTAATVSADGSVIVRCGADGTVQVWETATVTMRHQWPVSGICPLRSAVLDPSGRYLVASGGYVAADLGRITFALVDLSTGNWAPMDLPAASDTDRQPPKLAVAGPPDKLKVAVSSGGSIFLARLPASDLSSLSSLLVVNGGIDLDPNRGRVATVDVPRRAITVWDIATQRRLGEAMSPVALAPASVRFTPGGGLVTLAEDRRSLLVWAGPTLQLRGRLTLPVPSGVTPGQVDPITGLDQAAISISFPDPHAMVVMSAGVASRWDLERLREVGQPYPPDLTNPVDLQGAATYSIAAARPHHPQAAVSAAVGLIELWDFDQGRPVGELRLAAGHPTWMAFAPSGRLLASVTENGQLELWDVEHLRRLAILTPIGTYSLVGFPTEDTLVTISSSGQLVVWDVPRHAPRFRAPLDSGTPALALGAGGRTLALVDGHGAWLASLETSTWRAEVCRVAGRKLSSAELSSMPPGSASSDPCA